jgi:hypothetical protein
MQYSSESSAPSPCRKRLRLLPATFAGVEPLSSGLHRSSARMHYLVYPITNLADARYCAALGVGWLGFAQDRDAQGRLPLSELDELLPWVEGPQACVRYDTDAELAQLEADAIVSRGLLPIFSQSVREALVEAGALPEAFGQMDANGLLTLPAAVSGSPVSFFPVRLPYAASIPEGVAGVAVFADPAQEFDYDAFEALLARYPLEELT